MYNKLLMAATFVLPFLASAQKNITGLINAEKAFAKYALDSNTRDAFVKFLDTNCVVFNNGNAINGYQLWKGSEKRTTKLIWEPEFAAISSSNDYGVTTGPWVFKQTTDDMVIARGNFTSIWHYTSSGEWKNILDIGIGYSSKRSKTRGVSKLVLKNSFSEGTHLESVEKNFIDDFTEDRVAACQFFCAEKVWFNTEGRHPLQGLKVMDKALSVIPAGIKFTMLGSGIAADGYFGYVYGTAALNDKTGNYLRVWYSENGKWKLLLQTLALPQ